jgi:hypothetical protein
VRVCVCVLVRVYWCVCVGACACVCVCLWRGTRAQCIRGSRGGKQSVECSCACGQGHAHSTMQCSCACAYARGRTHLAALLHARVLGLAHVCHVCAARASQRGVQPPVGLPAARVCVRCGAVRCGAVRCGAVRCGAVRCSMHRKLVCAAGGVLRAACCVHEPCTHSTHTQHTQPTPAPQHTPALQLGDHLPLAALPEIRVGELLSQAPGVCVCVWWVRVEWACQQLVVLAAVGGACKWLRMCASHNNPSDPNLPCPATATHTHTHT